MLMTSKCHIAIHGVENALGKECGKEAPLIFSHGRKLDCQGMVIDSSRHCAFIITMFNFISNMLKEILSDMDGKSETPVPLHSFAVNENSKVTQFFIIMFQSCVF